MSRNYMVLRAGCYLMQMQLQLVLDLDGLGHAPRERAVGVAPLVPDLRR